LGLFLSGANEHDTRSHNKVWCSLIIKRPNTAVVIQHACEDKAYDDIKIRRWLKKRGYIVHIPSREYKSRENNKGNHKGKARRWVVERTGRWHNLFRRLKIRYEKKAENYFALVEFANAIICFRLCHQKR
jgi:transposase